VPNEICKALFYSILIKVLYHGFAPCGTINNKLFFDIGEMIGKD
jgi:hypothetical protein